MSAVRLVDDDTIGLIYTVLKQVDESLKLYGMVTPDVAKLVEIALMAAESFNPIGPKKA